MERVLRVQTVKLDGPGFSSISPERRRKVEKNRSNGAISGSNKFKMAAAAILDNFEWPYLHNSSRYSAHRAVIFAIAQLSCYNDKCLLVCLCDFVGLYAGIVSIELH